MPIKDFFVTHGVPSIIDSKSFLTINGKSIAGISDACIIWGCSLCDNRGWLPTTKDEKKLLKILTDKDTA